MDFIRYHADHREPGGVRWGVETICSVLTWGVPPLGEHGLKVAPWTSYEQFGTSPTGRDQRAVACATTD